MPNIRALPPKLSSPKAFSHGWAWAPQQAPNRQVHVSPLAACNSSGPMRAMTRTHGAIPRNMRDATQEGFSASFWQLCYKRSLKWFGLGSYIWVVAEGNGPRPHLSQELENTPLKNLLLINLQSLLTCPNTQKMKFCKWQCSRLVPAYHPVKNQYREQQRAALTRIQTLETLKPD